MEEASEDSRESTAETSNNVPKDLSPKDAALLESDVTTLSKALKIVSNEAARIVTRQHWRKCLIGNEKDHSYLVRAILKHSTPHVYMRVMEDHGEKMLELASDQFLDRAMEMRLKTIDAEELVSMLTKAKRLGYNEDDDVVVEDEAEDVVSAPDEPDDDPAPAPEEVAQPEARDVAMVDPGAGAQVEEQNRNAIAAATSIAAPYHPAVLPPSLPQNNNLPARRKWNDPAARKFVCQDCNNTFAQQGGLTYHMERKVCHRPAPQYRWFCKSCGKGFTTSGGKLYHEQNKVCQVHETAQATPPAPQLPHGPPTIYPMPSPNPPPSGSPPAGFASRPTSSHGWPPTAPSYRIVPYTGPAHPDASRGVPLPPPTATPNGAPFLPSQVTTPPPHPTPNSTDLRARVGSSLQSTPVRSSPGGDRSPRDSPALDEATQAELNAKLAAEVARFEQKCKEIPDTLSATDRQEAIEKEKRGHATRKSQIRKKYGIQIRTSKLQPANFVRIPGQGDAPILAPISRIAPFKAVSVNMTQTHVTPAHVTLAHVTPAHVTPAHVTKAHVTLTPAVMPQASTPLQAVSTSMRAVSTPTSLEHGRPRPVMESPDPKRRKLESLPPAEPKPTPPVRSDPYGVPGGLQRRKNIPDHPPPHEAVEVDERGQPDPVPQPERVPQPDPVPQSVQEQSAAPPRKDHPKSPQKRVQWEPLQPEAGSEPAPAPTKPSSSPAKNQSMPLADISNTQGNPKVEDRSEEKSKKTDNDKAVMTKPSESDKDKDSGAEDSDSDLDEEIPARIPTGGVVTRRSASLASASLSASSSQRSKSGGGASVVTRKASASTSASAGIYSAATAAAGDGRRGSMGRLSRAAVHV